MEIFKMKIAITGSSGFIGKHLINALHGFSVEIVPLDIKNGIDVTDWNQVKDLKTIDVIVHLAAKIFIPDSYLDPISFFKTNINSTINMLELCRLNKAKLIFISSYIYGNPEYLPIDEKHKSFANNPYSETKIIGEQLCYSYNRDFGIPVIIFRPFNIFGYGQSNNFLIPKIINQARSGNIVLKDSMPNRDFIYIKDVVKAIINAINHDYNSIEVFNIGSGTSYSVKEVVEMVIQIINKPITVVFSEERRINEVMDTIADITKAKKMLDWQPLMTFYDGLKETIEKNFESLLKK